MAKNKSKKHSTAVVHKKATNGDEELLNGSFAPKNSKSRTEDDFVLTISDSDSLADEESDIEAQSDDEPTRNGASTESHEAEDEPRGKKRKRGASKKDAASNKQAKKAKGDSGDMDSDFEFQTGDLDNDGMEELDGWGFEGAKPAMSEGKKGVDIDEIINRRNENKKKLAQEDVEMDGDEENGAEAHSASEESFIGLEDDEEDDVSADDAFGAGAESDDDEEESDEEEKDEATDDDADAEAADSDDESVASAVAHPDDDVEDSSSESDSERKAAFFAPESDQPAAKSGTTFQQMTLSRPILRGLGYVGFSNPTAIQASTIPVALLGRDVVGGAVTGSGKTAAYMVPILERLLYRPKKVPTSRVVVLCPTRELAIQVHAVAVKLAAFTDIRFALAVGGLSLKVQEAALRLRPDVIIATPGRFIDHMRNSVSFSTDGIEILVLDEADRMLDDGFADELDEILKMLPKSRQTMLFSATMTDSVDKLVRMGMQKPVRLFVDSKKKTVETLTQEFIRIRQGREDGRLAMLMILVHEFYHSRCIIFFRSKAFAHRVRVIFGLTGLKAAELHGSLSQEQRIRAVEDFRDGKVDFLLATDLASRGLDIKNVSYVINYELPQTHEIYLHRVGRTARAGRTGRAITLAAEADRKLVKAAVKAAEAQKSKVVSRKLDQDKVTEWTSKLSEMEDEIQQVLEEEAEERQMQVAEMQVKKGENLIKYEEEIHSRPKRTFPFSEKDKHKAKAAGAALLNGMPKAAQKKSGKLSGKKKKLLLSKDDRSGDAGKVWKKTKEVRIVGGRRGAKAKDATKARGAVSKKTKAKVGKPPKGKVKGKK